MALLFARMEHNRFLAAICAYAHPLLNEPLRLLMAIVAFFAMLISIHFVRLSLEYLTADWKWALWGSFLVLYMAYFQYVLDSDSPFISPCDLPSLAVFSVCLYLLLRRRWAWYYVLFIGGTFNRETTCFLTGFMIFFAYYPLRKGDEALQEKKPGRERDSSVVIWTHVLAQMFLWLGIRYYSAHFFSAAPQYIWNMWKHNLLVGFSPLHWASLFSSFGFLWLVYFFGFKKIPYEGLRRSAWLLVIWFMVMMYAGQIYEIRIYGELIPYMTMCVVLILRSRSSMFFQNRLMKPYLPVSRLTRSSKLARARRFMPQKNVKKLIPECLFVRAFVACLAPFGEKHMSTLPDFRKV